MKRKTYQMRRSQRCVLYEASHTTKEEEEDNRIARRRSSKVTGAVYVGIGSRIGAALERGTHNEEDAVHGGHDDDATRRRMAARSMICFFPAHDSSGGRRMVRGNTYTTRQQRAIDVPVEQINATYGERRSDPARCKFVLISRRKMLHVPRVERSGVPEHDRDLYNDNTATQRVHPTLQRRLKSTRKTLLDPRLASLSSRRRYRVDERSEAALQGRTGSSYGKSRGCGVTLTFLYSLCLLVRGLELTASCYTE